MPAHLIVTIIARDKPGIVEELSQTIARAGASWLGSRMTRLAGEFAGIVEVSAPDATSEGLIAELRALDTRGIRLQVESSAPSPDDDGSARELNLEFTGHDRPGIVREIAGALAGRGVNVHELSTHVESAPMSGDLLFHASARLAVPKSITLEELTETLEKIAMDVMVDLSLVDAD